MRFFVSVTFVFRLSLPIVQKNEQFLPSKRVGGGQMVWSLELLVSSYSKAYSKY